MFFGKLTFGKNLPRLGQMISLLLKVNDTRCSKKNSTSYDILVNNSTKQWCDDTANTGHLPTFGEFVLDC